VQRSAYHDYRVVPVVEGLEHPWSIAFLPGGDMLVTEQPGGDKTPVYRLEPAEESRTDE
jgi:glucose/arabinose dehydrogenase